LAELIAGCRVLFVDESTARRYAEIRDELKGRGAPIPANDLSIAALARHHDLPLLSRDGHFDWVPSLKRLGW
jgi:predicted nucleic acid-binding protein